MQIYFVRDHFCFIRVSYLSALCLRSAFLLGSNSQYLRSSKILSMTGFNVSERYGMPTIWKIKRNKNIRSNFYICRNPAVSVPRCKTPIHFQIKIAIFCTCTNYLNFRLMLVQKTWWHIRQCSVLVFHSERSRRFTLTVIRHSISVTWRFALRW